VTTLVHQCRSIPGGESSIVTGVHVEMHPFTDPRVTHKLPMHLYTPGPERTSTSTPQLQHVVNVKSNQDMHITMTLACTGCTQWQVDC
jgi:hypothetical protein